jgi:DinB family protein
MWTNLIEVGVAMIEPIAWMDRKFIFDQPVGVFPALLERLRGTPDRAASLVVGFSEDELGTRATRGWSVKEHLGHLIDLQPLDEQRLCEFLKRAQVLSSADMENRATESANHGQAPIADILTRLRAGRLELVRKLEQLTAGEVAITALHPRLRKPMRLLDWVYFVAEHDDHHLAKARRAMLYCRNPMIKETRP